MNSQYKETTVWKCLQCGRVLMTEGGLKRHSEKCKYNIEPIKGQLSIDDYTQLIKEDEQNG